MYKFLLQEVFRRSQGNVSFGGSKLAAHFQENTLQYQIRVPVRLFFCQILDSGTVIDSGTIINFGGFWKSDTINLYYKYYYFIACYGVFGVWYYYWIRYYY